MNSRAPALQLLGMGLLMWALTVGMIVFLHRYYPVLVLIGGLCLWFGLAVLLFGERFRGMRPLHQGATLVGTAPLPALAAYGLVRLLAHLGHTL